MFRRKRAAESPGTSLVPVLQLPSGDPGDGWAEAKPIGGSGVWVVMRFDRFLREGSHLTVGGNTASPKDILIETQKEAIEAMKVLYDSLYDINEEAKADGRYVALDFYGGDRVEAHIHGEWKVNIDVAPPALVGG